MNAKESCEQQNEIDFEIQLEKLKNFKFLTNYLKFLERARSEAIYEMGFSNTELKKEFGVLIIVKSCNIDYKKPAIFEDKLSIISTIKEITKTSFIMEQNINRNKELIKWPSLLRC